MVIKYDFDTDYLGYNETYNEDYFGSSEFEFEIDIEDMKNVATQMVRDDVGCDKETARKFVDNVLWNYDLLEEYLEANEDFVKEYFEERAIKEFRD